MNICLVSAPTLPEFGDLATLKELRETLADAPLGILSLAAVLEPLGIGSQVVALNHLYCQYLDAGGRQSEGIDFCGFVVKKLASSSSEIFGFSTICSSYPLTIRMAAELRRLRPEATVIFGGPQASVVDQETLQAFPWIDIVVRGEGEQTLPQLLQALSQDELMHKVPGITFRSRNRIARNPDAPVIQDLDTLPMPAYHVYPEPAPSGCVSLELGRGCPFACTFCSTNDFFRRRFRLKSPRRMLEQMTELHQKYGVRRFQLVHDMFTVDRKRVIDFCQTLASSGIQFTWSCSARTDCVDEELLDHMAEAGCRGIFFGIETGSARMQKVIDKGLNLEQSTRVVEQCHARGIGTTVSCILGFPEETRDDLRDTANFLLNSLRLDDVETHLQMLSPLAGTPVQIAHREKLFLEDEASEIRKLGWEQNQEEQQLVRLHLDIFSNFYYLPTQLDRRYLEEFNAFYLTARSQFRWLLIALHHRHGDIVTVFDEWQKWSEQNRRSNYRQMALRYYLSADFLFDFFAFVHACHSEGSEQEASVLAMLTLEEKWREEAEGVGNDSAAPDEGATQTVIVTHDSILSLASGVRLIPIDSESAAIIRRLRDENGCKRCPEEGDLLCLRTTEAGRIDMSRLSVLASELLGLCDGVSTLADICDAFSSTKPGPLHGLETLAPMQICVSGLVMLAERGLITFKETSVNADRPVIQAVNALAMK